MITILEHKFGDWNYDISSSWQDRARDFMSDTNGEILWNYKYPHLVIIKCDNHPTMSQIEDWFSKPPDDLEVGEFIIHYATDLDKDTTKEMMWDQFNRTFRSRPLCPVPIVVEDDNVSIWKKIVNVLLPR